MIVEQPGASAFTQLSDVPHSYSTYGSNFLTVKVSQDGIVFTPASGGSITIVTPTGTIDGSNLNFTVASEPKMVYYFGQTYFKNITGTDGFTWNLGLLQITMPFAPQPAQTDTFKAML